MATAMELPDQAISFNENLESNKILENMRNQRKESKFCDITLHVGDAKLLAHRSLLAASSPYFESILKNHRVTMEDFVISWHDVASFETLLNYMYSGEVIINEENVESLLHLAHHFHISKMKNYCEIYLDRYLGPDTCLAYRELAQHFNLESLWENASICCSENIGLVLASDRLASYSGRKFENFIVDPNTGCDSVALPALLGAIALWAKKDLNNRMAGYQKLLEVINWKETEPSEIFEHLSSESLYQESKLARYLLLRTLNINEVDLGEYKADFEKLDKELSSSATVRKVLNQENALREDEDEYELPPISVEPIEDPATSASSKPTGRRPGRPRKHPLPAAAASTPSKEPPESTNNVSQGASLSKVEDSPRRRSGRSAKAAPPVAEVVEIEPAASTSAGVDETDGGRRSRRAIKSKFSSQEWVTEDSSPAPTKKLRTYSRRADENVEDNVHFDVSDEEIEKRDARYAAIREARAKASKLNSTDEGDEEEEEEDGDSQDSKESSRAKIGPNYATLAQWREGVKCPHCIYIGHSASRLEQHLAKVHEENQTYVCKLCTFQCKWNREFYKHMKEHLGPPPYKCEDCEYTCDRIQFIISHKMRHTDERPFGCELCSFRSRTKGNLIVHMRIHTGEKPYRCQHCGRCFAMKNTLDQHLATHRDDRPFLCDICGFSTKYQSHLLSHKRIHTGNVFHCEQEGCNYFSPRRSQLAAHMRSHLSIRSHICSTCGRGFIEKSHLIRHERIHLEEKPFKCDQCDYGSTRRDKLKEHKLKHHSDGTAVPKAPYKPRRQKQNSVRLAGPVNVEEELAGQPIIIDSQDIIHAGNMTEQEIATANLIYEYAGEDGQVARVLIQPMGEFNETIVVEAVTKDD